MWPTGHKSLILRLCHHFLVTLESEAKGAFCQLPKGYIQAVTYFYTVIGLGFSFALSRQ